MFADVFENFRNKCTEIYLLDRAHFLSAPILAPHACLKKAELKLELVIDINMLLVIEKAFEVEYVMQYISMLKQTTKFEKL